MGKIERFEDIEAWQASRRLRQAVYNLSKIRAFATDEALVDQIRRAAISASSNIAEGFERGGNRELIQFLSHAKGSLGEIKDQLYCAMDEAYITKAQFDETFAIAETASRLTGGFMAYLRQTEFKGSKFERASASRSARFETQNSEPRTQNPEPRTQNSEP